MILAGPFSTTPYSPLTVCFPFGIAVCCFRVSHGTKLWRAISRDTFPSTALATAQRLAVTSAVVLFGSAARLQSFAVSSLGTRYSEPVRSLRMSNPFDVSAGVCWSMESRA